MTSPKWRTGKTVSENAREKLPELAGLFFSAGRQAARPLTTYTGMHRFRLHTKRFRYTLELFRDYYGPGLESRIESLRDLQQLLGAINDCSATQDLLVKRKDLSASGLITLRRKLERMARARVAAFRRRWSMDFSAAEIECSWSGYLAKPKPVARKPA